MRRFSIVCGTLLLVAAATSSAEAQLRPWEISIAGGPSFPTGELADEAGTGYHVQGSIGFDLPLLPFGLRADALWQEVPDDQDEWFRQIGGIANATFGIPLIIVEPYALAGVGFLRTETPETTHGGHTHDGETESLVGFNAGLGLEFPFAGLGGFIEARYLNLFGGGDATHYQTIPVTVGIRF